MATTRRREGTLYLAEIWESAWLQGGGQQIPLQEMKTISKTKLMSLYKRKTFLESKWLAQMGRPALAGHSTRQAPRVLTAPT